MTDDFCKQHGITNYISRPPKIKNSNSAIEGLHLSFLENKLGNDNISNKQLLQQVVLGYNELYLTNQLIVLLNAGVQIYLQKGT